MTTITKERIELFIKSPLENGLTRGEQMEVARIALASLEADPIGEVSEKRYGLIMDGTVDLGGKSTYRIIKGEKAMKLFPLGMKFYTAPPAPVSVPAAMEIDDDFDSAFEHGKAVGWNAYRAAMLQAEPVSNSDELPLDYLQGHKDGLEWAAQLAEANHPQTGDWLYDDQIDLARAIRKGPDMPTVQGGNSPVTPDGWISCSDRMPEDTKMLLAFSQGEIVAAYWNWVVNPIDYKKYRAFTYLSGNILDDVTHWMPLPEPPL
ncbi:TPA: DUF551 domain-containing protein [Escherichia coli]|nr:DUF551 domain-containing protein [Escherichia coli]